MTQFRNNDLVRGLSGALYVVVEAFGPGGSTFLAPRLTLINVKSRRLSRNRSPICFKLVGRNYKELAK